MPTAEKFSTTNILNSVALYFASKLLQAGYLVYFHKRDVLMIADTPSGWYFQFSENKTAILADSTVQTAVAAAKGLITIVDGLPAVPRFVVRLIDDTSVGPAEIVPVPAASVELAAASPIEYLEIGTKLKWRTRHLVIDSYVRTDAEQHQLKDYLALWFDEDFFVEIKDHDDGSLSVVGVVTVQVPRVGTDILTLQDEPTTYQVLLNARLTYVA